MKQFSYVRAGCLAEAYAFLSDHACTARVMAGGTDLIVEIRRNEHSVRHMEYVLDISGLKSLTGIREKSGIITIGALTTHELVSGSYSSFRVPPVTYIFPFDREDAAKHVIARGIVVFAVQESAAGSYSSTMVTREYGLAVDVPPNK